MKRPARAAVEKIVLTNVSTGERIERWPVDAKGMVESGEYTADTQSPSAPLPESTPVRDGADKAEGEAAPVTTTSAPPDSFEQPVFESEVVKAPKTPKAPKPKQEPDSGSK